MKMAFAIKNVRVRVAEPVYVIVPSIEQFLIWLDCHGSTTVRSPTVLRWLEITSGCTLADPDAATLRVFPVMLQFVPEVPVWPDVLMVRFCPNPDGKLKYIRGKENNMLAMERLIWMGKVLWLPCCAVFDLKKMPIMRLGID